MIYFSSDLMFNSSELFTFNLYIVKVFVKFLKFFILVLNSDLMFQIHFF